MKYNLNGLTLIRYIALASMIIDHVGTLYCNTETGRLIAGLIGIALPVMCFNTAIGVEITRDWKRYLLRVSIVAAMSQIVWSQTNLSALLLNDIWGFALGIIGVKINQKKKGAGYLLLIFSYLMPMSSMPVLLILISYDLRNDLKTLSVAWIVIAVQFGVFIDPIWFSWSLTGPLIALSKRIEIKRIYHGKLLYIVYPVHLYIIALINIIVE